MTKRGLRPNNSGGNSKPYLGPGPEPGVSFWNYGSRLDQQGRAGEVKPALQFARSRRTRVAIAFGEDVVQRILFALSANDIDTLSVVVHSTRICFSNFETIVCLFVRPRQIDCM